MRPLLFFGVIYVVFTQIFKLGKGVPHYGVYLLTGIVLWNYFGEATASCVQCLVAREAMLRKVRFPRLVIPLSVSLTALFNLGHELHRGDRVRAGQRYRTRRCGWLELIPIALGFVLLATGTGMLLSALYVRYRDVAPIWDVARPGAVLRLAGDVRREQLSRASSTSRMLNPFAMLLTQMGHAFIAIRTSRPRPSRRRRLCA